CRVCIAYLCSFPTRRSSDLEEVFIIGGGHIFEQCMPYADRLYVTRIEETFQGDVFFPEIDAFEWKVTSKEKGIKDDKNPYDYYLDRKSTRLNSSHVSISYAV